MQVAVVVLFGVLDQAVVVDLVAAALVVLELQDQLVVLMQLQILVVVVVLELMADRQGKVVVE
jgi:hypothetical protein